MGIVTVTLFLLSFKIPFVEKASGILKSLIKWTSKSLHGIWMSWCKPFGRRVAGWGLSAQVGELRSQ